MKYLPTSPRDWWQFTGRIFRFYRSTQVPSGLKVGVVALCLAYLLLPIDLLPDFIPFLGQLDDISVIGLIHLGITGWASKRYSLDGGVRSDGLPPESATRSPRTVDVPHESV